ncbi:hypothetical protein Tco_1142822 [Tanacetum coccineum]
MQWQATGASGGEKERMQRPKDIHTRLGGHDELWPPSKHPEKKHNEETSANLARTEPGKYSREVGVSKETSGEQSPREIRRSWYVEGHVRSGVINTILSNDNPTKLGYKGVSSREAKMTRIFIKIEILSFDMITKDFKVIGVLYSLEKQFYRGITISKVRESLVLLGFIKEKEELDKLVGGAWMMEHDGVITSFKRH